MIVKTTELLWPEAVETEKPMLVVNGICGEYVSVGTVKRTVTLDGLLTVMLVKGTWPAVPKEVKTFKGS